MRLVVLVVVMLAGCSSGGPREGPEVTVASTEGPVASETVAGDGSSGPAPGSGRDPKRLGHIAGHVLTDTLRPLANATVRIPSLDFETRTDREGVFGFVDLEPGPYFVVANMSGFHGAESMLDVEKGTISRVKFLLSPGVTGEPYHITHQFHAWQDLTTRPTLIWFSMSCEGCEATFALDAPLAGIVLEGTCDSCTLDSVNIRTTYEGGYREWTAPLPFRVDQEGGFGNTTWLRLVTEGRTETVALDQYFTWYVTLFYNEPAPSGWSILAGDT